MLLYHPAFDSYHGAFRLLLLLWNTEGESVQFLRLRILDFFLLFPAELASMSYPLALVKERRQWKATKNRYNEVSDPRRVFDELESYQLSGLQVLLSTGLARHSNESDDVVLQRERVPAELVAQLQLAAVSRSDLLKLLTAKFKEIGLPGPDGLKARTGLFEYRHDPA